MNLPKMVRIRQHFQDDSLVDPQSAACQATVDLLEAPCAPVIRSGQRVAVAAGSRGIANIAEIITGVVAGLKEAGLRPFIVPAMGSHGGGTAERQQAVLEHYGVTEERVGAPVVSSTETVLLGRTPLGVPVTLDRHASEADHILVVNRIKPHTHYDRPVQSGCAKMLIIGLGKPAGALGYHRAFRRHTFAQVIETTIPWLLERVSVLGGIAILENALEHTARIVSIPTREMLTREPPLLEEATQRMARLPFSQLHVLIVDRMGKDISGTGIDTNVIGRVKPGPDIEVIIVLDLTAASEGNATGIGLADITVQRLIDKMDAKATFLNCATAVMSGLARVPYSFPIDREAIEASFGAISVEMPQEARIVHIRDTLSLSEMEVSECMLDQVHSSPGLEVVGEAHPMAFDADGNLINVFDRVEH